jgi:hypothetical protein
MSKEAYLNEVIGQWIREHGYDGLYSDECGCLAEDLAPCCGNPHECRLGYNYGPRETPDGHADFWIGPQSKESGDGKR